MAKMAEICGCDGVMDRIAFVFCDAAKGRVRFDNSRQIARVSLNAGQFASAKVDGGIDLRNGKTSVTA